MKKIIAISVMLALVVGAVFAQPSIGGNMKISVPIIKGNSANDYVTTGSVPLYDVYVNASWQGDNAGGMMRLYSPSNEHQEALFAFWWWKPLDQLRLQLGKNPDGDWGHAQITGWGFHGEAQGGVVIDEWRGIVGNVNSAAFMVARRAGARSGLDSSTGGWYPGFNALGLATTILPLEGLTVNLGIPFGGSESSDTGNSAGQKLGDVFLKSHINVTYAIPDIGTVKLATILGPGYVGQVDDWQNFYASETNEPTKFWLAFYLSAVENLGAELSLGLKVMNTIGSREYTYPLQLGIGANYGVDDFRIKARIGASFGGLVSRKRLSGYTEKTEDDSVFGINLLPSYNFGAFRLYCSLGLGVKFPGYSETEATGKVENNGGEATVDFYINPYITIPASSGTFYAGFKLLHDGTKDASGDGNIRWEIPISWNVYF
jgi:hypothetical protein